MHWLDIILLVLLFIPTFIGLRRGLIRTVLSLLGLIIGVVLAGNFYKPVSNIFGFISNESVAHILAFLLILALVMGAAFLIARLLKSIVSITMLGWVDNVGGAALGFLSGFIFLSAILATWVKFFGNEMPTEAFLGKVMLDYFPLILGLLPGEFGETIRSFFQT
ncbi:MAG: CvpA family protein [Dehalococcoidia bacterium]|nr:MAG: CvpA family protein [Dehalococcoidia bacterium]